MRILGLITLSNYNLLNTANFKYDLVEFIDR